MLLLLQTILFSEKTIEFFFSKKSIVNILFSKHHKKKEYLDIFFKFSSEFLQLVIDNASAISREKFMNWWKNSRLRYWKRGFKVPVTTNSLKDTSNSRPDGSARGLAASAFSPSSPLKRGHVYRNNPAHTFRNGPTPAAVGSDIPVGYYSGGGDDFDEGSVDEDNEFAHQKPGKKQGRLGQIGFVDRGASFRDDEEYGGY